MKIVIVAIITFVLAATVLVGFAGIENVLAQQPRKSTFDNAINNIAEAEPAKKQDTEKQPVPEGFVKFLDNL